MVKVQVHPADIGGCGYYRLIWPAQALQAQGADVDIVLPLDGADGTLKAWMQDDDHGYTKAIRLDTVPECDVLVMQRPMRHSLVSMIPLLQKEGVRVVVELDDDFSCISPQNVAFRQHHPRFSPYSNWKHLQRACSLADMVTVTTPALARRYGIHGRVEIIPNYVPRRYLSMGKGQSAAGLYIGWSGTIATHPHDLQQMGNAVPKAVRDFGVGVCVVGSGIGVGRRMGLPKDYEIQAAGWVDIDKYPDYMQLIDIGLVPLELTAFNQAKSWLKGLEFAALGVPFVASPTEPYQSLTTYGIGRLAAKPKEWLSQMRALVRPGVAAQEGDLCRRWVVEHKLTIEQQCDRWWAAWERAKG